jgi:hypothetical protein
LRLAGAEIIDPFVVQEFDQLAPRLHPLSEVRASIERYLAKTRKFPKSLAEVVASGKFHPLHEVGLLETSQGRGSGFADVVRGERDRPQRDLSSYCAIYRWP